MSQIRQPSDPMIFDTFSIQIRHFFDQFSIHFTIGFSNSHFDELLNWTNYDNVRTNVSL